MTEIRACDKQNEIFMKKYMHGAQIVSTVMTTQPQLSQHVDRVYNDSQSSFYCLAFPKDKDRAHLYWYFALLIFSILSFKHAKPTQALLPSPMYGREGIDSIRPTIFMTLTCTQLLGLNAPYEKKNREGVSAARSKRIACVQTWRSFMMSLWPKPILNEMFLVH